MPLRPLTTIAYILAEAAVVITDHMTTVTLQSLTQLRGEAISEGRILAALVHPLDMLRHVLLRSLG